MTTPKTKRPENFTLSQSEVRDNGNVRPWHISWWLDNQEYLTVIRLWAGQMDEPTSYLITENKGVRNKIRLETEDQRDQRHITWGDFHGESPPDNFDDNYMIWPDGVRKGEEQAVDRFKAAQWCINLSEQ